MAKKLIALISTEGKSPEQIAKETKKALKKFQKVAKKQSEKITENVKKTKK